MACPSLNAYGVQIGTVNSRLDKKKPRFLAGFQNCFRLIRVDQPQPVLLPQLGQV